MTNTNDASYLIWQTRLRESLALLDQVSGTTCECDEVRDLQSAKDDKSHFMLMHLVPNYLIDEHGNIDPRAICIQCNARLVANHASTSEQLLENACKEVLCHIDDIGVVEFGPEHPVEAIRYWATVEDVPCN